MAEYRIQGSTLDAIADAINAKTGGSSAMTPAEMVTAIGNIPSGGGSGYAKKTGSFVLSENYNYATSIAQPYTGMLVDTGLQHIDALIVWSEEWNAGEVTTNSFGVTFCIDNSVPTATNVQSAYSVYSGNGNMYNGVNNPRYASVLQCAVLHSASNNVPEGKFGIRCHLGNYPILAGDTIRWEAWGEE